MPSKTLSVPSDVGDRLEETSKEMGLEEEEIIGRAITMYIDAIKKDKDLKKEFSAWDKASDEALSCTEKSLQ